MEASTGLHDESGNFEGFLETLRSEHRTVGPHRAWSFTAHEWCYPDDPCADCEEDK